MSSVETDEKDVSEGQTRARGWKVLVGYVFVRGSAALRGFTSSLAR